MTSRELLAAAFPLHFQTILERIHECGRIRLDLLDTDAYQCAGQELKAMFLFRETPEGHDYWYALADRCRI